MTAIEFSYAISQCTKTLKPYAIRLTRDSDEAADLLQDTVLKAILHRDKFSEGTNLNAWMYTIMKNTYLTNHQRAAKRKTFVDTSENLFYLNSSSVVVKNQGEAGFEMEDMNKALGRLESTFREPFMMYFQGYKYDEISARLHIPLGTVKNRIHLARKELKTMLRMYKN